MWTRCNCAAELEDLHLHFPWAVIMGTNSADDCYGTLDLSQRTWLIDFRWLGLVLRDLAKRSIIQGHILDR